MTVTMFEAKTRLSELVQKAQSGEEIIITSGRKKTPVARLEALEKRKGVRLGALYNPNFRVSPDFWEPMSDEDLSLWEGKAE